MKNIRTKAISFFVSMSFLMTACSAPGQGTNAAEEYVNDETVAESSQVDEAAQGDSVVVAENIMVPEENMEESGASASTSTIEKEEEPAKEEEKKQDDKVVMVFIGDSQMANGREDGTDLASLLNRRVPNSKVYNLGIGGTTASVEMSTTDLSLENWTSVSFMGIVYGLEQKIDYDKVFEDYPYTADGLNRIDPEKVDYYFIEYGANDFFKKVPLDKTQYDGNVLHTYYGALDAGIAELKKISPQAKIILMTPFYGIYTDTDGKYLGDSYIVSNGVDTLANYARKCMNVAEDNKVIDFDTINDKACDLYLDTADQYLMDGTHLTATGRRIFARLLAHIPNFYEKNEPYAYLENDYIKINEFDPGADDYFMIPDSELEERYPEAYEQLMNGAFPLARANGAGQEDDD